MAQTERKEGYYWVRHDGDWFIAKYEKVTSGELAGLSMFHYTYGSEIIVVDDVEEVKEIRIPSPDEALTEQKIQ